MQKISSKDNEIIKHIRKLKDKKYRDESNEFVIEGVKLVAEAIQENSKIKYIVLCDDCERSDFISKELMYEIAKYECIYVTEKLFKYLSQVQTPQGVLAIIVALDDIQDPGNLGTILRTVDSVGLTQILVSKGTADCYNPKVVRSTMGAIFRIKIIECEDLTKTLKEIRKHKFKLVVTSLQTDKSLYDINFDKKVIVIGNEANGVSKDIQDLSDEKIKIPMIGKTESLNASVATGVVLYEYVRQKLGK